jgi:hypothetical protein
VITFVHLFILISADTSRLECAKKERRNMTVSAFLAILLKVLSSPALIAGLIAFLQKTLHP